MCASHPPKSPLLCLMGSSHRNYTHTIPQFSHRSFTEHTSGSTIAASPHSRLVHQDQTLPHTVLGHTHIGSWLYYFTGGRSMNRSLDLGMIINHKLLASHQTTALNCQHHTGKFQSHHPKSYSPYQ
jgi:hypothetical protein